MTTYRDELRAIANELHTLAAAPPGRTMTGLSELIDNASPSSLIPRLRAIRSKAAADAVDLAGSQSELARQEGVSRQAVYLALRASRPHASRDGREPAPAPPPAKAVKAPRKGAGKTTRT